MEQKAVHIGL